MENQDQSIVCSECGQEFVFTAGERQFYIDRGFEHPPKRCKPCRAQRKQQSGRRDGAPSHGTGNQRNAGQAAHRSREREAPQPQQRSRDASQQRTNAHRESSGRSSHQQPSSREVHVTTCQACGTSTKVPFRPQEGRGVYCPECYHALKALSRASKEENFT